MTIIQRACHPIRIDRRRQALLSKAYSFLAPYWRICLFLLLVLSLKSPRLFSRLFPDENTFAQTRHSVCSLTCKVERRNHSQTTSHRKNRCCESASRRTVLLPASSPLPLFPPFLSAQRPLSLSLSITRAWRGEEGSKAIALQADHGAAAWCQRGGLAAPLRRCVRPCDSHAALLPGRCRASGLRVAEN